MIVFPVIFLATILGLLGAILGVPMALLFKVLVLEADDQNRWIAKLMGSITLGMQLEILIRRGSKQLIQPIRKFM